MQTYNGDLKAASGWRVAFVVSRFNELITNKLVGGAADCLNRFGISEKMVDVFWVPGAFEIPAVAQRLVEKKLYTGILCLGSVIRGATPHFDYVAGESAKGIASLSRESEIPVMYSILTTDTIEQAIERAGTKGGNKGADAALGLVEMISLYQKISILK